MNLSHFDNYLKKAVSLKQAENLLNKYLSGFAFSCYAFTYYSGHIKSGRKLPYHYASEALLPWHLYYLGQDFADVDRTLEEIHSMTYPVFWDVKEQLSCAKSKREKDIRLESIAYGLDKGLSLSVHGPNCDFVTLTLHQRLNENCLKNYKVDQYEWWNATAIFYHHLRRIMNFCEVKATSYHLTRREKQCLLLTAKSWRVEKIAKELKLSPRTINFHIQNANKKLGTNNKYQAVNKYFELALDTDKILSVCHR